jgi:mRNA-degrading endonuclease RelE of RelBE toxin-antitoxin system
MAIRNKFEVVFAPETISHLGAIEAKYHSSLQRAIQQQLYYLPDNITRNKKPLDDPGPLGSIWELRCGPQNRFRIFYEVLAAEHEVHVLAIGVKERNKLYIAGKEYSP